MNLAEAIFKYCTPKYKLEDCSLGKMEGRGFSRFKVLKAGAKDQPCRRKVICTLSILDMDVWVSPHDRYLMPRSMRSRQGSFINFHDPGSFDKLDRAIKEFERLG